MNERQKMMSHDKWIYVPGLMMDLKKAVFFQINYTLFHGSVAEFRGLNSFRNVSLSLYVFDCGLGLLFYSRLRGPLNRNCSRRIYIQPSKSSTSLVILNEVGNAILNKI